MRNVAKKFAEDITNDAKNTLNHIVKHIANQVANDWMIMATSVMDDYYGDYSLTTKRYDRTYSLFSDAIESVLWKKSNAQKGMTWYHAGIRFYPDRMDHGLPHKLKDGTKVPFYEEDIWENFMRGEHGNKAYAGNPNARNIAITTPSPKSVLDSYYMNYETKLDKYFDEAVRLYST